MMSLRSSYSASVVLTRCAVRAWSSHEAGVQKRGVGPKWVEGGVEAPAGQVPREHPRGIEVCEGRHDAGVGEVVRRDVDCLHTRDRPLRSARDAFLELADL